MRRYFEPLVAKVGLYGFVNGLNLLLSGNIINFWLASYGINSKIIGFFSFIALPYALKYFIAIFINHFHIKNPQYKTWLITSRILLTCALIVMSWLKPETDIWLIAITGFFIALFSVVQDIILNANRIKTLNDSRQIQGSAINNVGYHLGMLISGAGVIYSSSYTSWSNIFLSLALVHLLLTICIYFIYKEPKAVEKDDIIKASKFIWFDILIKPFKNFMPLKNLFWLILFALVYRLSDNMMMVMVNPFFLKIGFDASEIAGIYKFFGAIMVILGGVASGFIIPWFGIRRSLLVFGIAHIFGTMLYLLLSLTGKNFFLFYLISTYDAITGGMVMTAYITFVSSLCKGKYIAAQYAFLSSIMGFSRVIFPMASGIIVDSYGMTNFFLVIITISFCTMCFTNYVLKHKHI